VIRPNTRATSRSGRHLRAAEAASIPGEIDALIEP
jgi:hypothetical protein